jgi:hypothetical protein
MRKSLPIPPGWQPPTGYCFDFDFSSATSVAARHRLIRERDMELCYLHFDIAATTPTKEIIDAHISPPKAQDGTSAILEDL